MANLGRYVCMFYVLTSTFIQQIFKRVSVDTVIASNLGVRAMRYFQKKKMNKSRTVEIQRWSVYLQIFKNFGVSTNIQNSFFKVMCESCKCKITFPVVFRGRNILSKVADYLEFNFFQGVNFNFLNLLSCFSRYL